MKKKFSLRARLKSFAYAFRGLAILIGNEHNAWIHLVASIVVLALAFKFEVTTTEWIILVLVIGLVWMAEAFNTAIERLADKVNPGPDENIKTAKDLAASAVLIAALVAAVTGVIIFGPRLLQLLNGSF